MRRLAAILSLLAYLFLFAAAASAAPVPPDERAEVGASIPPSDFGIPGSQVQRESPALYDAYPISNYQVDGVYGVTDLGARLWAGAANALLLLTAVVVKLAIRVVEWSFTLALIRDTVGYIDDALRAMGGALWDTRLVHVAITCAGMWAAWVGLVLRRTAQAVGIMVTVVVIVALASWSFAGGLPWALRFANDASSEISGVVLTGVSRTISGDTRSPWTASAAFTQAGEAVWTVLVGHPWALAEFGDLWTATEYQSGNLPGDQILIKDEPGRQKYYAGLPDKVRERDFAWWLPGAVVQRFVIALLAFVVGVTFAGMLMALGIGVLAYQLLALFVLAAAPIVFLLGLIFPNVGGYLVGKWAIRVLGAVFMKVVLSGMLALVLLFSLILFRVGSAYGWAAGALLQLVLVAVVVLKWRSLMGFLTDLPASPERAMHRLAEWHEPAMVRAGRFAATSATQGWLTSRWIRREKGEEEQVQQVQQGRTEYRHSSERRPGHYRSPDDTPPPAAPSLANSIREVDENQAHGHAGTHLARHGGGRVVSRYPSNRQRGSQRVNRHDSAQPRPRLTLVKPTGDSSEVS